MKFEALCERVKIESEETGEWPDDWTGPRGTGWKCTLRFERRRLTVPFYQGAAHCKEPTAAAVLSCLLSDVTSIEQSKSFSEWAADLGYDVDSRKAFAIWQTCRRLLPRMERFLGDDFRDFAEAAGEY